jgi:hypothetical protein
MSLIQINFTIDQDWSKLLSIYDDINSRWVNDKLSVEKKAGLYSESTDIDYQIDLGVIGSLHVLTSLTKNKKTSSFLHGKVVETNLSCYKKIKDDLKDFDIDAICLFRTIENINPHVDMSKHTVEHHQYLKGLCKIIYVIKGTDPNARFFVDGIPVSFITGTTILADVTKTHALETNGVIYLLQIIFNEPYDRILKWVNQNPNLSY